MRLLLGAERRDCSRHRFGIVALVDGHDLVVGLGRVEVVGDLVDPLAVDATHRVPPLDLGGGERG
jgi:hypothetical protein